MKNLKFTSGELQDADGKVYKQGTYQLPDAVIKMTVPKVGDKYRGRFSAGSIQVAKLDGTRHPHPYCTNASSVGIPCLGTGTDLLEDMFEKNGIRGWVTGFRAWFLTNRSRINHAHRALQGVSEWLGEDSPIVDVNEYDDIEDEYDEY